MNNAQKTLEEVRKTDFDLHLPPQFNEEQVEKLGQVLKDNQNARSLESADLEKKVSALQTRFLRQRTQLLGSENEQLLRAYTQQHRLPAPEQFEVPNVVTTRQMQQAANQQAVIQQRADSINYAQQLGVDLSALNRLQLDFKSQFESLTNQGQRNSLDLKLPSIKPAVTDNVINYPPNYAGWWDRGGQAFQSGSGKVKQFSSTLNPASALIGNTIWSQNMSASNSDYMVSHRENGLMVWHTLPYTARLRVEVDFQCAYCQHCLQTWDEFGWSDGSGWTNEAAVVSVFWNWADSTPATENIDYNLVWGLGFSGDGEKSPGIQYPVSSGLVRRLTLTTQSGFPAGATVAVYVGAQQRLYAWMNDVSVNSFVHSQWYLSQINVLNV